MVEVILGGDGVLGHLRGGGDLYVLHELLEVGDVDAEVVEGEGEVQHVGVRPPVHLGSVAGHAADGVDVPGVSIVEY